MAKLVYDVELTANSTTEEWGKAFLSYNRGFMYVCNGNIPYTDSPYVMNYFDDAHMGMTWIYADSHVCNGAKVNGVAGKKDANVGALAVFAYLCGSDSNQSSGSASLPKSGLVSFHTIFEITKLPSASVVVWP